VNDADADRSPTFVVVELDSLAFGGDAAGRQRAASETAAGGARADTDTDGRVVFVPLVRPASACASSWCARRSASPGASWSPSSGRGPIASRPPARTLASAAAASGST